MALLQIRRGNQGTKGTLQYGEPFFNSDLQSVQFGASGSEQITLVKLNDGVAPNAWGESGSFENSGSLSLTGDITASNIYVRGDLTVSGNLKLGDSNLDSVTVVADFTSDLIPDISNSFDLGTATKYWKTAYLGSLSLAALAGADAENNIVYVNSANQLTASNDFEFIPGDKIRLGSGSYDRFWVKSYTGDTFISGNLYVSGASDGIKVVGSIESLDGFVTAEVGKFHNLSAISGGAGQGAVVLTSASGELTNDGNLKFDGQFLRIGGNNFTIDSTNGNIFTTGAAQITNLLSGSSAKFDSTLTVGGASQFNNQVNISSELIVNGDIRANASGSFGNGLNVSGNVVLNANGSGYTQISGSTTIGDNTQNDFLQISGAFEQRYSGSAKEELFTRISPFRSASILFDDDNSPIIPGAPGKIVIRNQSRDGALDAQSTTGITSSGIVVSNTAGGFGSVNIAYLTPGDDTSLKVNIGASNGIALNSRTQITSNLSVSGSTILGQGGDDLLTIASPTTMSGDLWNQGYTANLGTARISSSLTVSGSTELLGNVKMGDLRTTASSGIIGSASIQSHLTVGGDVYVGGNRISLTPKLIEIGSGSTIPSQVEGSGIYISGAAASFVYQEAGNRFANSIGLKINGGTPLGRSLEVSGSTYMTGGLEVSGNLAVYGNINLGNVTITNTASIQELIVNNNISGGNNLNIANNAAISGNLAVFGNETLTGTLKVNSATAVHSTLNVTGAVGLNNTLNVTGSTAITGGLFVSGNTTLSSSLTVKEYSFFEKNMRVSGNLQVDGNLEILGDVTQLQVSNLQIEDKNIIIASGSLSSLQSDAAGLTILGPTTPIQFNWDHSNTRMDLNKNLNVSGNLFILGNDIIDTATALAIALGG